MSVAASITVRVPLTVRRRPGRKTVVTPAQGSADATLPTRADPALVKALARAFRYQRLLDQGRYASISEMAAAEKIDRGYLGRVLQLTLLAPDIVEAILDGSAGPDVAAKLLHPLPAAWPEQWRALLLAGSARRGMGVGAQMEAKQENMEQKRITMNEMKEIPSLADMLALLCRDNENRSCNAQAGLLNHAALPRR